MKKYRMFVSAMTVVIYVNESLIDMAEKSYDHLEEEEEEILLWGVNCPCLEAKHRTWAFANRKLKKMWKEIGCELHCPADTIIDDDCW